MRYVFSARATELHPTLLLRQLANHYQQLPMGQSHPLLLTPRLHYEQSEFYAMNSLMFCTSTNH